ncbi:MAG: radical SAM protein [Dehalococcoidales bacterium]|nr:radical SAM protein [Dehalococcoidales bacterium]
MTMSFERPAIVRPPSEASSLFLPLTAGCSNSTCTFCGSYGSRLQIRDIEDVRSEIDAVALFLRHGLTVPEIPRIVYAVAREWDGKGVFLQDSDALVYPYSHLRDVLTHMQDKLPFVERVAAYATASDILRRSPEELEALRELKLGILYIGMESGDDDVLRHVDKGVDSAQIIEATRRARAAGILTSITVILGLGGVEGSEEHSLATARVLSDMDPDFVGALTLTLVPGTPLYREWQEGSFEPISPFRSLEELILIIQNSSFTDCFFSSMHASNYMAVRGTLPHDRQMMLAQLRRIVEHGDPRSLRPDFLRGL